jgi:hypothetical protein
MISGLLNFRHLLLHYVTPKDPTKSAKAAKSKLDCATATAYHR